MTSKKNDTSTAPRSPARAVLAARIEARDQVLKTIEDKRAAARRLVVIEETAQSLTAQLGAALARDAQRLADHALNPECKKAPILADDERAQLRIRVAEASARAEAAGPAKAIVEQEIVQAHADLRRAEAAVQAVVANVILDEMRELESSLQKLNEQTQPLHALLAGLRHWANIEAITKEGHERDTFTALTNAAAQAMKSALVPQHAPTGGAEEGWKALAERLLTDPDFSVANYAEAA